MHMDLSTSVKHLIVVGSSLRKQEKCFVSAAIAWLVQVKHVHTYIAAELYIIQINVEYLPTTKTDFTSARSKEEGFQQSLQCHQERKLMHTVVSASSNPCLKK